MYPTGEFKRDEKRTLVADNKTQKVKLTEREEAGDLGGGTTNLLYITSQFSEQFV